MPQTLDALAAIKEADIPFIVAITKIDKNNADVDHAKMSLLEHQVLLEGMGGDVSYALVSSKTGEGVSDLLDLVLLAADLKELTADPNASASGFVLEATQDQKRGASVTLIIKDGTLTTPGFLVAGDAFAPIRFIEDFKGERVTSIGPSAPARISGFNKLPQAGSLFLVVKSRKEAETLARKNAAPMHTAAHQDPKEERPVLALIVKTDVSGSVDAIIHELSKQTHEKVVIRILSSGVGPVSETDVKLAQASGATIIAFNIGTDAIARELAERSSVAILSFSIIYELAEQVAKLLEAHAPTGSGEKELGRAKILKAFSASARKQVLGARYISGVLSTGDRIRLLRGEEELGQGRIITLQQARSAVQDIKVEGDFGIEIEFREPALYNDELIAFSALKP